MERRILGLLRSALDHNRLPRVLHRSHGEGGGRDGRLRPQAEGQGRGEGVRNESDSFLRKFLFFTLSHKTELKFEEKQKPKLRFHIWAKAAHI